MSINSFLLVLAVIFFIFAAFNFAFAPIAWQWLGFAFWAASGVRWATKAA